MDEYIIPNSPPIPDDVFFCPTCRTFHKDATHKKVHVPGVDYVTDPETMKVYKVAKWVTVKKKKTKGFAKS